MKKQTLGRRRKPTFQLVKLPNGKLKFIKHFINSFNRSTRK